MDRLALHEGVASAYRLISAANEFIAETQPWTLAKDPAKADRLSQVLYDVAEAVRIAAVLLLPVMPSSAAEILRRLGETSGRGRSSPRHLQHLASIWRESILNAGALWPRLEDKGAPNVSENTTPAPAAAPASQPRNRPHRLLLHAGGIASAPAAHLLRRWPRRPRPRHPS